MRVNRIVAVMACLCPLAPAQTDNGLWRFVHPDAKALIGVDVRRIRSSRVVAEMSSQLHTMPIPMGMLSKFPGLDLIGSVDRVLVSSPGRISTLPEQEPPLLIAVSGRFEPVKLRRMLLDAGAKEQVFNSVTIFRLQGRASSDFGLVVLNSQTLLIGDVKSLFSTIERVGKATATLPPIIERARDMDVAYDFWAILLAPPAAMAGDRFPIADLAGKLNGFEAGVAVRDGLAIDVNLNAISENEAKEISSQLSKLIHLAGKDRENHPEWSGIDHKMKITVEHADVHVAVRMDAQTLSRVAKAFDESRTRHRAWTAGTAQPAAKPAEKQVIRIEGLDAGPREIPYHPENK